MGKRDRRILSGTHSRRLRTDMLGADAARPLAVWVVLAARACRPTSALFSR